MASLLSSRGCVYQVSFGGGGGSGLLKLDPSLDGSASSPILLQGNEMTDRDILSPKPTLEKVRVVYKFGKGFGAVTIVGIVLLGPAGTASSGMAPVFAYMEANRSDATGKPCAFSMGGGGTYKYYLDKLSMLAADPELNIQTFSLSGIIVPPP